MSKNFHFPLPFICVTILSLFIDINQFFLLGTLFIPLLFCIYCSLLFYDLRSLPITAVGLLQCIESFCFYNNFLLPLLYFIPITIFAIIIKKRFYPSFSQPLLYVLLCTTMHIYIIEKFLLHISKNLIYTATQISVIILVEICFSLTINYWGMLDNRA